MDADNLKSLCRSNSQGKEKVNITCPESILKYMAVGCLPTGWGYNPDFGYFLFAEYNLHIFWIENRDGWEKINNWVERATKVYADLMYFD